MCKCNKCSVTVSVVVDGSGKVKFPENNTLSNNKVKSITIRANESGGSKDRNGKSLISIAALRTAHIEAKSNGNMEYGVLPLEYFAQNDQRCACMCVDWDNLSTSNSYIIFDPATITAGQVVEMVFGIECPANFC